MAILIIGRLARAAGATLFAGALTSCALSPGAPPAPRFRDVARAAGVDFRHANGRTAQKYFVETMGSGVALFDYDNNGWLDILCVNGRPLTVADGAVPSSVPGTVANRASPLPTLRLYRNLADGAGPRFADATEPAGLAVPLYGMGCAVGDFDNDGWSDVYVSAALDAGRLFRNDRGRFVDVTRRAGVGHGGRWGSGCAWLDYDRDGRLDLYIASYVPYRSLADDLPCFFRPGRRSYCVPAGYEGISGALYRNEGGGHFADVTRASGLYDAEQKALGVLATDIDDDGWTDLLVANDTVPNRLFQNRGKRFEEVAVPSGLAFGPLGSARGGMGIDAADWRNDGRQAVAITNFAREATGFYVQNPPLSFEDQAAALGISEPGRPFVGFGIRFLDVDNDGLQDLCVVNGHVRDEVAELEPGQSYPQPALLYRNERGEKFRPAAPQKGWPLGVPAVRRALAAGDLNNDGRTDLVAVCNGGPAEVWLNETSNAGHWLAVRLQGQASNRDGIGARLRVRAADTALTRWVSSGGSYLSESDRRVHFGLGTAVKIESLSVRWPSGQVEEVPPPVVDRVINVVEGTSG